MLNKHYKQAIVVRSDLKMQKGKIAAQVAHAALTSAEETRKKRVELFKKWFEGGQKKVVLKVESLDELLNLIGRAKEMNILYAVIEDSGLTQIPPGTITCAAFGPDKEEKIEKITGNLKLL
ncbi:MAG: peptidyl-tRNA hydrolase Pth2 [Nitrososphaeria archaeon]